MIQRLRGVKKDQSGFTLIELLIAVVILGVLSGIVVFSVSKFNGEGKVAACKADVKNVEVAVEAFYAKSSPQAYPSAKLVATDSWADLVPSYLKEQPSTDNYTIKVTATGVVTGTMNDSGAACS